MVLDSINVEQLLDQSVNDLDIEIVERKGKGHPDSLIDGASESVSRALCAHYLKNYDAIHHHNVDKGLLVGGNSKPVFGGGVILDPIYMVVAGRATANILRDGKVDTVPVGNIATTAIKEFIRSTMRFLDPETHVVVDYKIKPGSADLRSVFYGSKGVPLSNDTSVGVAYAPLTITEQLVLETERLLNSSRFKESFPEIGEDIKVMGLRRRKTINLTVAAAMVSPLVPDASHYQSVLEQVKKRLEDESSKVTDMDVVVHINSGDNYSKGVYYLTVTGTSAEMGDDGNTGRGNRPNGLISPMRQYSMEAAAGKNPVNHTGKIFNVLAQRMADRVQRDVPGIKETYVRLLSRIGAPISDPQVASVALKLEQGVSIGKVKGDVESIVEDELSRVQEVTPLIISGSVTLF
ncbi:MAG: methionine adenosyltransferase [Thaumarchaeota archaeon]|nr:methionine adenosyltransferase [Nitrososphaerota archaeon]